MKRAAVRAVRMQRHWDLPAVQVPVMKGMSDGGCARRAIGQVLHVLSIMTARFMVIIILTM